MTVLKEGSLLQVSADRIPYTIFIRGDVLQVVGVSKYESNPPPLTGVVLWEVERIRLGSETVRWCRPCGQHVLLTHNETCILCGHEIDKVATLARAKANLNLHLSITPFTKVVG